MHHFQRTVGGGGCRLDGGGVGGRDVYSHTQSGDNQAICIIFCSTLGGGGRRGCGHGDDRTRVLDHGV